jgi:hypothetical protein
MQCKILMSIIENFPSYIYFFPSFGYMIDYSPLLLFYVHHILLQFLELKFFKNVALEEVSHVIEVVLNYEVNLNIIGHAIGKLRTITFSFINFLSIKRC